MLNPDDIDLEELVMALSSQDSYDVQWFIDPKDGSLHVLTDAGLGGDSDVTAEDLEDSDLMEISPLPSWVFYGHMESFVDTVEDPKARTALKVALEGRGAFRRFKDTLHGRFPELLDGWHQHRAECERTVAIDWLIDERLIANTRCQDESSDSE